MGKNRRPTLSDVAEQVGVTKMTVSRYLNNPQKVAKKTGEQIQIALDDIGYIQPRAGHSFQPGQPNDRCCSAFFQSSCISASHRRH